MFARRVCLRSLNKVGLRRVLKFSTETEATRPVTVDIHSHFLPKTWQDFAAKYGTHDGPWPWMRHKDGQAMLMLGNEEFRPVDFRCWDIEQRLQDMDRDHIDYQLLSATPILFQYHRSAQTGKAVAAYFNDLAHELSERSGGRIFSLAQVPLQDIDAACEEASRACRQQGLLGVQIGNHVGDIDLDDRGLITFLHHCANEGIPVLVHPWDMLGMPRTARYMMGWTVGMPAETQLSIVSLILSGALDELPKSLKICFAHGGGSFAFLLGRLQNAYLHRDIARGRAKYPPKHYVDRFSVDSAVFDEGALSLLVEVMGEDRVMLGSDYPYPLGEQQIGSLVRDTPRLNTQAKKKILGANAIKFFNIPQQPRTSY